MCVYIYIYIYIYMYTYIYDGRETSRLAAKPVDQLGNQFLPLGVGWGGVVNQNQKSCFCKNRANPINVWIKLESFSIRHQGRMS